MANTNPQAITFTNERARPLSDLLYATYLTAKNFVQQWTAQNVAAVIPNDSTIIADGAATSGRNQVTNAQINVIFAHAQSMIAYFEGATAAPVNNASLQNLNQVIAVEVNGTAKF